MKIAVVVPHVLYIEGGAEYLARSLHGELSAAGHAVEMISIPFRPGPPERLPEQMLLNKLIDISAGTRGNIDLMIGLKFPSYLATHPNKVLWLCHQHREAYDLWDYEHSSLPLAPEGQQIRELIHRADSRCFSEAKAVYTISNNVSMRLLTFCGVESTPIYNPPFGEKNFYHSDAEDYLLFPSRINVTKRQELAIEALAKTKNAVRLYIAGAADHPTYQQKLIDRAKELGLTARVKWLGALPDLYDAYARCLGVVFVPLDEDYGYVTLEAMLSSKPVITCTDSGGTLEFVSDGVTGMTVAPTPEALAEGMDILWENRETAERYGREGRDHYRAMNITWSNVTERLLQ